VPPPMFDRRPKPSASAAAAPVIVVEGLTKRFSHILAVDDVSFTAAAGTTTALLGGNGAGKTTTLTMLLGLLIPTAGRITVLGRDMIRNRFPALAAMNFSSPYVDLPRRLTVRENLRVYGRLYGLRRIDDRIGELASALGIADLLGRTTGALSAGQKTKVVLAKSLLNRPRLLLLDEPTASLDPDTADWVRGFLERYRAESGASILLASHNMAEVERLCDDVLVMRSGRIVDRGAPDALIRRYGRQTMEEVFLDIARQRAGETARVPA
jgi:ABC-2 type transport system ATP-binding protein